jgi:hypothetical protein
MLQDFSFKIVHRPGLKHTNVNAFNRNPMGLATNDDDFNEEIQDIASIQINTLEAEGEILSIQISKETKWFNFKRQEKGLLQHHECCFGINRWRYAKNH